MVAGEPRVSTVGIMSMQRIFNYGSSLQAYSLKRLIEATRPDAEVRFLDYVPGDVLVEDTGIGMDAQALAQAHAAFFCARAGVAGGPGLA